MANFTKVNNLKVTIACYGMYHAASYEKSGFRSSRLEMQERLKQFGDAFGST